MTFSSLISAWRVVGAGTTPAIYDTKIFANTDLAVYFDGVLMTLEHFPIILVHILS